MIPISEFKNLTMEEQMEYVERERNIAFATIASFSKFGTSYFNTETAQNMLCLYVPLEEVEKFVSKFASFYSLYPEQTHQLLVINNRN